MDEYENDSMPIFSNFEQPENEYEQMHLMYDGISILSISRGAKTMESNDSISFGLRFAKKDFVIKKFEVFIRCIKSLSKSAILILLSRRTLQTSESENDSLVSMRSKEEEDVGDMISSSQSPHTNSS